MFIDELFANHLFFMANHRGSVRLAGRDIHVDGPTDELTSFVPGSPESACPHAIPAVRIAPWSGEAFWSRALERAGLAAAERLVYMEYADRHARIRATPDVSVTVAGDIAAADAFAAIQSAGFATGEPAVDDWWRACFTEQARANLGRGEQRFYLGWRNGVPVTSTLAVQAFGVTGIYAVATVPEHRGNGASATVLERVRQDASACACARLVLQAVSGSYAERYYRNLGFAPRYSSQVWRR
jgi:GNAT superfamily N-acetyltransferase